MSMKTIGVTLVMLGTVGCVATQADGIAGGLSMLAFWIGLGVFVLARVRA